ncbi:MAG: sulfatase [Chloroflexi bacterium]|nr:sulfatase [Chloroflexota bacterium]
MKPAANVLFVTCHDLGRHLGCYGRSTISSPALDAFAASGAVFDQAWATAPQCSPSRAAMHTGRYPHSAGMLGLAHDPFGWRLAPDALHLAARLRAEGYATVLVGLQHLSQTPFELGYDRVLPLAAAPELGRMTVGMLRTLARDAERPFYLEVGFEEPHRPYDFGDAEPDASRGVAIPPYLPQAPEARADLAAFQGATRVMDAAVGQILAELDVLGLRDRTWVIFATDHGIAMPRAKATLYDPGLEIALLMRWPNGGLSAGQRLDAMVSNVDVTPTVLEGLGLPIPADLQGRSCWPLLRGEPYLAREEVFAEKTYHTHYEPMRGVRTAAHKLILNLEVDQAVDVPADVQQSPIYPLMISDFGQVRPTVELYDLASDPLERTNLADRPELMSVQDDLLGRLRAWMKASQDPILDGPVASPYYASALTRLRSPAPG